MRIDRVIRHPAESILAAQFSKCVEHLALKTFHEFHCDKEEVPSAARGVEDARFTKSRMKFAHRVECFTTLSSRIRCFFRRNTSVVLATQTLIPCDPGLTLKFISFKFEALRGR